MSHDEWGMARRVSAEALGTALLLATVVGSGIMGERLAGGIDGIALLGNTIATGAILVVLILIFGPISGAHFNPAVTLAFLMRRDFAIGTATIYILAQIAGGVLGVWVAHAMFEMPVLSLSGTVRHGPSQWLSEGVASFGLVATILGCLKFRADAVPYAVGLFITAGYWFTASTSFANPAVTIARSLTDTFSGIAPSGVAMFIVSQICGAVCATLLFGWLLRQPRLQA